MHAANALHPTPTLRDAEHLVGIPYVPGTQDCMHLYIRAAAELFGRQVRMPGRRHPVAGARQAAWMGAVQDGQFEPVAAGDAARSGDLVLWLAQGDRGAHFHVGMLIVDQPTGEAWVLHSEAGIGASVLQRLADTRLAGMRLEGLYRWI